ncbi:MAG: aminotransferase class I/II-fold pyridoxal phosphate-dependent enzyme [Planctomycetota bacterium]|nr:aminotransferase class I/II-fold pyridoxal phosphate-dependent enzyme [Planctomycetota bacterium]MDA1025656.1 aminotransferase class I/II-fold pyridoxal phosphate-dependent enzyme [Planctomycetota bacterium]
MPTDSTEPTDKSITNDRRLSRRVRAIDASGIRRAFELGGSLERPINLSIGQPDFPVPTVMKDAAVDAIRADRNGYTVTQGIAPLHEAIRRHLAHDLGWNDADAFSTVVTGGTSGGLLLASLALLEEGDEAIIPDPWFVLYPQLGHLTGATMVPCDTYPDFRMTAARVEPLITDRTKFVLVNSPGNPSGVVLNENEVRELAELCRGRGVQIITDEIYDEFVFADAARPDGRCPSPARFDHDALVIRGFGKTYGCTGWRLGYAAGPTWLIEQMRKLQQFTFVCAPSPLQWGVLEAFDIDNTAQVEIYARRREMVMDALSPHANVVRPGGAFYAFLEIPAALGMTGTEFMERAVQRRVLLVPGGVFSGRDTHVRLSFAVPETTLQEGLDVLVDMIQSG